MRSKSPDCICPTETRTCPVCVAEVAISMRYDHPDTLTVSMLKRRLGHHVSGFTAAVAVECTKPLIRGSPAHAANRDGRYDKHSPASRARVVLE